MLSWENICFNPYLFSIILYYLFSQVIEVKYQILIPIILFLPALFGYEYTLSAIIIFQILILIFGKNNIFMYKQLSKYYFIAITVLVIGEGFAGIIQQFSTKLLHNPIRNMALLNLICVIPEMLFCLILFLIINKYNFQIRESIEAVDTNISFIKFISYMLCLFSIIEYSLFILVGIIHVKGTILASIVLVLYLIVLLLLCILIKMLKENKKYIDTKINQVKLLELKKYLIQLEKSNVKLRKIRHDYKNSLVSLIGFLNKNDIYGAEDYLTQLIDYDKSKSKSEAVNFEFDNLKIDELKYFLIYKLKQAQEKDIFVKVEINKPISYLPGNIINLLRCLGILLDNAIEACSEQKNREIDVLITKYSHTTYLITIRNTIERSLDIESLFRTGKTSKKGHQGLGLTNLNEIINQEAAFSLDVEQTEKMISFELELQSVR